MATVYRIGKRKIESEGKKKDKQLEKCLNRPYKWLQKKFKKDEVLSNLEGYLIILDEELPLGCARTEREERIIRIGVSEHSYPFSLPAVERNLSHESIHVLRGDTPYETPDEIAREEGAAMFGELLYGIERGGEVAEKIFSGLIKYKPYSYNSWNGFHSKAFEKEFGNYSKN